MKGEESTVRRQPFTKEEMDMYDKIMVPLDGSALAECVLPHVEAIANGCPVRELILLRVIESERTYTVADTPVDPNLLAAREIEAKKTAVEYLNDISKRLDTPGLKITAKALVGRVAENLVDHCIEEEVDLIIIATHGRSGVTRWVRGSVADKILRSSRIPVMVIRAPGTEEGI